MGSVHNFLFDRLTTPRYDDCASTAAAQQNQASSDYLTTNYFANSPCMTDSIKLATSQPNIYYNGGNEGRCNVDVLSQLKLGGIQTHPKCRISLLQRPFATVPYLGKGPHNADVESSLQQSVFGSERKSESTITDKNHLDYRFTPQIPSLSASIQNPSNLVEEVAAEGWVRGGLPTKDMTRQSDYLRRKNVEL